MSREGEGGRALVHYQAFVNKRKRAVSRECAGAMKSEMAGCQ